MNDLQNLPFKIVGESRKTIGDILAFKTINLYENGAEVAPFFAYLFNKIICTSARFSRRYDGKILAGVVGAFK